MKKPTITVLKFGSSVLADGDSVPRVVDEIQSYLKSVDRIVAVVSAFGDRTDQLEREAMGLCPQPSDSVIASYLSLGEMHAAGELTLALQGAGVRATARAPWEVNLRSRGPTLDAVPESISRKTFMEAFNEHRVVVFPGFIGRGPEGEPQLLGRGGSDLSAIFLAVALEADQCILVKDTEGIYQWDPARPGPRPARYAQIGWEDAVAIEGEVLQKKAIEFAWTHSRMFDVTSLGANHRTSVGANTSRFEYDEDDDRVTAMSNLQPLASLSASREVDGQVGIVMIGWGKVGRSLSQLVASSGLSNVRRHVPVYIVGICDRSGYLISAEGLSRNELVALRRLKEDGIGVGNMPGAVASTNAAAELVRVMKERRGREIVLVDTSDSDTSSILADALSHHMDVVTANKIPMSSPNSTYAGLLGVAKGNGRALRYEAAIGAALPIVDTLETMVAAGDVFISAEASLSGTINYLLWRMETGASFSHALEEARNLGYTEPDPLLDLRGEDVRRKTIILGRVLGADIPDARVEVEPLIDCTPGVTSEEELTRLGMNLEARMASVRESGKALRYVSRVGTDCAWVGPAEVPLDSALARLGGTVNTLIVFTEHYLGAPLVITGPGAGVDVTSMAIWMDVLRVVSQRFPVAVRNEA